MDGRILALATAALALWVFAMREAWRAWQPGRLLVAGRYLEAKLAAERLERSWMARLFRGVRLASRCAIGAARHLEGDLEGSSQTLGPLVAEPRVRGNLRYVVCSTEAANLVLLDRDPERAIALLEEAGRTHRPAEDLLLAAHARRALGESDAADRLFHAAGTRPGATGTRVAIFHALRGLYAIKLGRNGDAQRDLEIAAESPIRSVYVERARQAIVQAKATELDDPRSSLAPQVVAAKRADER